MSCTGKHYLRGKSHSLTSIYWEQVILLLEYLAFVLCIHFISYVMKQKKSKRYERQGIEISVMKSTWDLILSFVEVTVCSRCRVLILYKLIVGCRYKFHNIDLVLIVHVSCCYSFKCDGIVVCCSKLPFWETVSIFILHEGLVDWWIFAILDRNGNHTCLLTCYIL